MPSGPVPQGHDGCCAHPFVSISSHICSKDSRVSRTVQEQMGPPHIHPFRWGSELREVPLTWQWRKMGHFPLSGATSRCRWRTLPPSGCPEWPQHYDGCPGKKQNGGEVPGSIPPSSCFPGKALGSAVTSSLSRAPLAPASLVVPHICSFTPFCLLCRSLSRAA